MTPGRPVGFHPAALIELRLTLSRDLRERRQARHLTQTQLASRLHSSQSRVAKMEAGDASVSMDLMLRGLFALGATFQDIGRLLKSIRPVRSTRKTPSGR